MDLGNIAGEISWNNGGAGTTTYAFTEGFYIATLTSSCGESIDSVYVSELEDSPQVNLGVDTTLCEGAELNLAVFASSSTTIEWNDGDDIFFNSFSETGIIWVELSNLCGVTRDSLYLTVIPAIDPIILPADVTICDDQSYTLESGITQDNIVIFWNTLENTTSIEVSESGLYWVQAANLCFQQSDTFKIDFLQSPSPFDLGENDTICFGESLFIDGFQGDEFTYNWQDNSVQSSYSASQSGTYALEVSNFCGSVIDEMELLVLANLSVAEIIEDNYILCEDETLSIDLSSVPFQNIFWNDGSTDFQRILTEPGEYFIDLLSICNDTLLSFVFEHKNCIQPGIYFPNLFSPNNDGVNDFFSIDLADSYHLPTVKVSIFNRWGEEVFYSEDPDFEWDGTFKNLSTNPGVFAYFYELEAVVDGEIIIIQKAGDITIVK